LGSQKERNLHDFSAIRLEKRERFSALAFPVINAVHLSICQLGNDEGVDLSDK
jgi:hypothetical protein